MKNATLAILFFGLVAAPVLKAQTLQDALKLTDNERYAKAQGVYKELIAKEPTNGDYFFYYGDNYFRNGDPDSARIMYKKGAEVNPTNPLPSIGLGKVSQYAGNLDEASKSFVQAKSLISTQAKTMSQKKQAEAYLRMADAYINAPSPNKNLDEALKALDAAEKADPTNPEVFLLRGDYLLEKDAVNGTPAIKVYEKAASLDPKSAKAQLRIGQLWVRANNLTSGVENFQKAIALDSNFAPAWRAKGDVLLRAKKLEGAKASYIKYLQLNNEPGARLRYASALYLSNEYKSALAELETVRKQDSTQILLWRLLTYCYYETGDYAHAKYAYEKYFKMTTDKPNWRIVSYDYEYRGKTNSKLGQDSLGLLDVQKAYDMDTTRRQLLFDMGGIAYKWKKYDLAAQYFQKKINTGEVTASDYLNLGRAYYSMKNYALADSSFGMVIQKQPSASAGYFWRARARLATDTIEDKAGLTKGLAKQDYEKHIDMVMALTAADKVEKNKKDLIESYSYLGFYHYVRKNYGCAKYYYQEIQKLDANNEKAKTGLADKGVAAATAADPATCK